MGTLIHIELDMVPYYLWGNTPNDSTTITERFFMGFRGASVIKHKVYIR